MALAAGVVWEVRTGGADTNGGGFVTGASGTDRSLADAPFKSGTNLTVHAVTNTDVLPDGYTPAEADVGNIVQITSTAPWTPGFYEIKSIQSGYWRLDRSPAATGTASGVWAMGGALATPGMAGGAASVSGHIIYLASGTYTLSVTTANVAGGPISLGTSVAKALIGYKAGAARTDRTAQPLIDVGAQTTVSIVQMAGSVNTPQRCVNIAVDGNGNASVVGFDGANVNYDHCYQCLATACTTGYDTISFFNSKADTCTTGFNACTGAGGYATGCTTGIVLSGGNWVTGTIASGGTTGFSGLAFGHAANCVAYGCSGVGFTGLYALTCYQCVAVNCGNYGFTGTTFGTFFKCAGYSNTPGNVSSGALINEGFITLSGDPFLNAGTGDFRPDATTNEGALLRAAGYGVYGQTNAQDIGAVQHADPVIVTPAATSIYNGAQVTSDGVALVTGTLHASNISTAAGGGSNLSAGVLQSGVTVDDVAGTLTIPVPVFGGHVARRV